MVQAAQKVVVVCDSSKFGRHSLAQIMPTAEIDSVITDRKLKPEYVEALREAGVSLTLA